MILKRQAEGLRRRAFEVTRVSVLSETTDAPYRVARWTADPPTAPFSRVVPNSRMRQPSSMPGTNA